MKIILLLFVSYSTENQVLCCLRGTDSGLRAIGRADTEMSRELSEPLKRKNKVLHAETLPLTYSTKYRLSKYTEENQRPG